MPAALRMQIAEQVRTAIIFGLLRPGQKLPSHREMADRLGLSTATVRDALQELHDAGLIEKRTGQGLFVAADLTVEPEIGALPRLARLQGMRNAAAAYRAGLQGEAEERARRAGAFAPQVVHHGGKGPLRLERQWVGARFRQAVRQAIHAGLTLQEVDDMYRAAVEWEMRPR